MNTDTNMVRRSYCLPESLLMEMQKKKPNHKKMAQFVRDLLVVGLEKIK